MGLENKIFMGLQFGHFTYIISLENGKIFIKVTTVLI